MQIIVPDLSATEDVDVAQLQMQYGLDIANRLLERASEESDKEYALGLKKEAEEFLGSYCPPENAPTLTIGFVPPAKRSQLANRSYILDREAERNNAHDGEEGESEIKTLNDRDAQLREWIRFGVKGHRNMGSVDFESVEVDVRGRKYTVASWDMVDLYECMGLLYSLSDRVIRYNTLDSKKKKKS